jgi:hypothetical protein
MLANICTIPISVPIAIDLLSFVEMGEKVVAIALEIVANEGRIVAVGDEAHALGQERIFDLHAFEADRALLARDLRQSGKLVDQLALRDAAQGEGISGSERKPVEDRRQRKSDERRRERAAEDDDEGMHVREHAQIAAHHDERAKNRSSGEQAEAGGKIHGRLRWAPAKDGCACPDDPCRTLNPRA